MTDHLFLNLSNHPSSSWSAEQRGASLALAGAVLDHPFPNVPPEADEAEVAALAAECLKALPAGEVTAAMVAGEPTLCVHLVAGLQARGVVCYAATTERRSVVGADGVKTSVFAFKKWRAWPGVRVN
jgi:hypothetical protein